MPTTLDWYQLMPATELLVHGLHYVALAFMIVAYTVKIRSILKKPAMKEGTPARGEHNKAIRYAFMQLARPEEMESTRKHWWRWIEFSFFHMAMAVGIGVAFVMPLAHEAMKNEGVIYLQQFFFAGAALIGMSRLVRRIVSPAMRAISSPDDYFCLILLTAWMVTGVFTAPQTSEAWLLSFYILATFFLFYVPFSKISHYICWPFMRYYMGKHFGHRGVYPKKRIAGA
jgi:nitrate reductase gamma subunit